MTTSVPLSPSQVSAIAQVLADGSPQLRTLIQHLRSRPDRGISQLEASALYRIAALPRRMADLSEAGVPIRKERRPDPTGRSYVRYFLGGR